MDNFFLENKTCVLYNMKLIYGSLQGVLHIYVPIILHVLTFLFIFIMYTYMY